MARTKPTPSTPPTAAPAIDLAAEAWQSLRGREHIKRLLEVVAVGSVYPVEVMVIGCPGDEHLLFSAAAALNIASLLRIKRPCPCGNLGSAERACTCSPALIDRYRADTSDYDLPTARVFAEMHPAPWERMTSARADEPLSAVRERRDRARSALHEQAVGWGRYEEPDNVTLPLTLAQLLGMLDAAGLSLLKAAHRQLAMSQWELTETLRIANVIAVMAGAESIGAAHLAEAVQYRPRRLAAPLTASDTDDHFGAITDELAALTEELKHIARTLVEVEAGNKANGLRLGTLTDAIHHLGAAVVQAGQANQTKLFPIG